jgi:cobalamin biosynthesis protein CobW
VPAGRHLEEIVSDRPIPALVVSGFLGSGKTTLVRQLLDHAQTTGARVAFISNELGELGVDQAMLGGGEEAFVELAGGCVCCALNDELYDTLIMLKEQIDPDRIVIETSGVAIPHDVQITFYQPPICDWISEEAVVVVVNAEQMLEGRDLGQTFTEQLESADLVVLHKVDLVPDEVLPELGANIERINPGVAVVRASHGQVDPRLLLAERGPRDEAPEHCDHAHHHEDFEAREVSVPAGLSAAEVEGLLRAEGALRTKGFVQLDTGPHLVQGVGRRIEMTPSQVPISEDRLGRVVVIRRADA